MSILDKEYIRQFITNDVKLDKDLNGEEIKKFDPVKYRRTQRASD